MQISIIDLSRFFHAFIVGVIVVTLYRRQSPTELQNNYNNDLMATI